MHFLFATFRHARWMLCAGCAAIIPLKSSGESASAVPLPPIYNYRAQDLATLRQHFAEPPREAAPWIYWMWFDNVVSKDEIKRELTEIAEAGFGGIELRALSFFGWEGTPPVPKDDAVLGKLGQRRLEYMSEEFLDTLEYTCAEAERLHLRFALNMGMGWPPGGPWITDQYRSKHLSWVARELESPEVFAEENLPKESMVLAWKIAGSGKAVDKASFQDLSAQVQWHDGHGALRWQSPPGRWLVAVFRVTLGARCDKGLGYEADPGSAEAVEFHLNHLFGFLDPKLHRFYGKTLTDIASDSWEYERSGAQHWRYWSPTIPEAFRQHTGDDLRASLYALAGYGPDAARIVADLERVEQKLTRDNFLAVSARMLHQRGLRHRPQLYGRGLSRDYLEAYALADVPEIEQWEFVPEAPWSAHTSGHPIISAESFTFLSRHPEPVHAPHGLWEGNPAYLRWHANNFLSLGINRLQFHSFGYSPPGVPLPGWRIYAETHFNRNVPWWPYLSAMTTWLRREQWVLQSGEPLADALVYPVRSNPLDPPYNTATDQPESAANAVDAANARTIAGVRDQFVAGRYHAQNVLLLEEPRAGAEAAAIADFQKGGVPLVRVPRDGSKSWSVALDELRSVRWPQTARLAFQHRHLKDAEVYFVVNQGEPFKGEVSFPHAGGRMELWDADQGTVNPAARYREEAGRTYLPVSLGHFEATLLSFSADQPLAHVIDAEGGEFARDNHGKLVGIFSEPGAHRVKISTGGSRTLPVTLPRSVSVEGPWRLSVQDAQAISPQPPSRPLQVERLVSWRAIPELKYFAGTVTYSTTFEMSAGQLAKDLEWDLDLGQVYELARVRLNGKELGTAWSPPYHLRLGGHLKQGPNTLTLEVANVLKNCLEQGDDYRRPSGLLGPVKLVPQRRIPIE